MKEEQEHDQEGSDMMKMMMSPSPVKRGSTYGTKGSFIGDRNASIIESESAPRAPETEEQKAEREKKETQS